VPTAPGLLVRLSAVCPRSRAVHPATVEDLAVKRWRRPPLQHPLAPAFARAVESLCTALTPSSTRNYNMVVRHFLVYPGAQYPDVIRLEQLCRDPHILGWMACLRAQTPPLASEGDISRIPNSTRNASFKRENDRALLTEGLIT
jgi:hypothetical protein